MLGLFLAYEWKSKDWTTSDEIELIKTQYF